MTHDEMRRAAPQPRGWMWQDGDWARVNRRVTFAVEGVLDARKALVPAVTIRARVWRQLTPVLDAIRHPDKRSWLGNNIDYMTTAAARALVRKGEAVRLTLSYRKRPHEFYRPDGPDSAAVPVFYYGITSALARPGRENAVDVPNEWDAHERFDTPDEWEGHPLAFLETSSPLPIGCDPTVFTLPTPFGPLYPPDADELTVAPLLPLPWRV